MVSSGVLLTIAYDGARFSGFSPQPGARTVAGELAGAIRELDPRCSAVRGTSRTDAGVHARSQLVAFDTERNIDPRGWVLGLSRHLPRDLAAMRASRVRAGYDPRDHVRSKTYRYVVLQSPVRDPLWSGRAWLVSERLNHEALETEARALVGQHDFAAFRGSADARTDTVRTLFRVGVERFEDDTRCFAIEVQGDRFLYRMVRIIVGTLIDVARGRIAPGAVERALAGGTRDDLGITAPADGLYLERIDLSQSGSDDWPDQSSNH